MPVLELLRARLEEDRKRLQSEIAGVAGRPAEFSQTEAPSSGNDLTDRATDNAEDEKAVALEAQLTGILNQIEAALSRMDNGTYGICDECGKVIAPARLQALPYATTCVRCAGARKRARVA